MNLFDHIEYLSPVDSRGRCTFMMYWWAPYHPGHPTREYGWGLRGQVFRADPHEYGFPLPEETITLEGDR